MAVLHCVSYLKQSTFLEIWAVLSMTVSSSTSFDKWILPGVPSKHIFKLRLLSCLMHDYDCYYCCYYYYQFCPMGSFFQADYIIQLLCHNKPSIAGSFQVVYGAQFFRLQCEIIILQGHHWANSTSSLATQRRWS